MRFRPELHRPERLNALSADMLIEIGDAMDRLESHGSPDKVRFMDIARAEGLQAALAWRAQRFEPE